MDFTVKTFEEAFRDSCEDRWEEEEYNRNMMETIMATPPAPLYRTRRGMDTSGVESTAGTFAWNAGAYRS